jgi:hypothetical protein
VPKLGATSHVGNVTILRNEQAQTEPSLTVTQTS